jgi:hypothetical protein
MLDKWKYGVTKFPTKYHDNLFITLCIVEENNKFSSFQNLQKTKRNFHIEQAELEVEAETENEIQSLLNKK